MEDNQIFRKIKNGDIQALECLYSKYHPKMYVYCKSLLKDADLAKDAVQEAFVIFWEHREKLQVEEAVSGYLFRITRHLCLRQIRQEAIKNNFSDLSNVRLLEIEANYYTPEKNILDKIYFDELSQKYNEALKKLHKQCQVIFEMSKDRGMNNAEIAHLLHLSVRTVENQLYRGLKKLKKSLLKYSFLWLFIF
ncbi:MAG: RNA polymerase sigma-70 factor [Parabacteroides sp.]|nr:RNA polymerase sigma-70 factor [Parabacteroides sp.]